MPEFLHDVSRNIEDDHRHESAGTRRQLLAGAAATLGSLGLLTVADRAAAQNQDGATDNDPPNTEQNIVNVAATAEVLATIVNTVGAERTPGLPARTRTNIQAAARHEVIHYETLTSARSAPRRRPSASGCPTPSSRPPRAC